MQSVVLMHNSAIQHIYRQRPNHMFNNLWFGKYPLYCILKYQDLSEIIYILKTQVLYRTVLFNDFDTICVELRVSVHSLRRLEWFKPLKTAHQKWCLLQTKAQFFLSQPCIRFDLNNIGVWEMSTTFLLLSNILPVCINVKKIKFLLILCSTESMFHLRVLAWFVCVNTAIMHDRYISEQKELSVVIMYRVHYHAYIIVHMHEQDSCLNWLFLRLLASKVA